MQRTRRSHSRDYGKYRALLGAVSIVGTVWLTLQSLLHSHTQLQRQAEVKPITQRSESPTDGMACHAELHAEYDAPEVVLWGASNILPSAEACCAACAADREAGGACNVWVHCDAPGGCGGDRASGECWLKHHPALTPSRPAGGRGPNVPWTSGALFTVAEAAAAAAAVAEAERADAARREALRQDPRLPLVYLDVEIGGEVLGRILFVLFVDSSPRAAENFRALCAGDAGVAPEGAEGAGLPYHLKGRPFYRIIDRFIDQSGAGTGSVFGGGTFADDPGGLALRHDRPGLLSMANVGPDTNTSHFSITIAPAHHLDGHYTIFGEVVEGMEHAWAINRLSVGQPDNTATEAAGARITDSGMLRGTRADELYPPTDASHK